MLISTPNRDERLIHSRQAFWRIRYEVLSIIRSSRRRKSAVFTHVSSMKLYGSGHQWYHWGVIWQGCSEIVLPSILIYYSRGASGPPPQRKGNCASLRVLCAFSENRTCCRNAWKRGNILKRAMFTQHIPKCQYRRVAIRLS